MADNTSAMRTHFDLELDLRQRNAHDCLERAMSALAELHDGQVLRVLTTDPESLPAFKALPRQTGHALIHARRTREGEFVFYIEKAVVKGSDEL